MCDEPDLSAVYLASGSELAFPAWPFDDWQQRRMLMRGDVWWDPAWASWEPPADWSPTTLPQGWADRPPAV